MNEQIFLEAADSGAVRTYGVLVMSNEPAGIPTEFLLKQIENEINAGFLFVAAAHSAYKHRLSTEAEHALKKAAEKHQQVSKQISDSPAVQVRAITHQLTELREAIDWLRESHFSQTNKGTSA